METTTFTVRLRPFAGESLSSYLRRLSTANGINFLILWNLLKSEVNHYAQYEDVHLLDFYPSNIINIEKLSKSVCVEIDKILSCTLFNLLNVFAIGSEIERSRFTSGMMREILHYCPTCLMDKQYHRLLWRVKGIDACWIHHTLLQDKCPQCKKGIKYRDMNFLVKCPYCETDLDKPVSSGVCDLDWEKQEWLFQSLNQLLSCKDLKLAPQHVALRILYLLSNKRNVFDKTRVLSEMKWVSKLPTLLQHARDSLKQKRTLHISYILDVLMEIQIDIDEFLTMELPPEFIDSVVTQPRLKKNSVSCQAPWCANFGVQGSLIKTGTSFNRKQNGEVLSYYLACLKCGCEYALNAQNELQERTYFIEGYNVVKSNCSEGDSIDSISKKTGLSLDRVKRCHAYFYTRGIKFFNFEMTAIEIDDQMLDLFIAAVQQNVPINRIRNWDCWESYMHFLMYRFHEKVTKQLLLQTRSFPERNNKKRNTDSARKLVDEMYEKDIAISVEAVAQRIGVSATSIRNWGCCQYISKMKKSQFEKWAILEKENIYDFVDTYLVERVNTKVFCSELYKELNKRRNVLWRVAPELTAYIHQRVRLHNNK